MANTDDVGIGDFVLLDEITVERVVQNLKTRYVRTCVRAWPRTPARIADAMTGERRGERHECARARTHAFPFPFAVGVSRAPCPEYGSPRRPREGVACVCQQILRDSKNSHFEKILFK